MSNFKIISNFKPTGDQPQAIAKLVKGLNAGEKNQVLLGVTGSGKSVVSNTPILIKLGKRTELKSIGELVDQIFVNFKDKIKIINETELMFTNDLPKKYHLEAYSFDPLTKETSWKPISQFTRHQSPDFLYKIRTTCGRELTTTCDHNFFVLRQGEMQLIKTIDLKESDYIPIPLNLDYPVKGLYSFQFTDYLLNDKYYLNLPYFSSIWHNSEKQIRTKLSAAKIHNVLNGNERVSLILYKQLLEITPEFSDEAAIGSKALDYQFGLTQPITPNLLRLLGYYVAEGHSTGKFFLISSADQEIVKDFSETITSLGLRYRHRPETYDYQVSSSFWSELLINLCGRDSKTKHLPVFWMQLTNQQLAFLLGAYFSGDGGVNRDVISTITASKQLASELMYALLRFGVVSRVRHRLMRIPNSDRMGNYWEITISWQHFLSIFQKEIGFYLREKNNQLIKILNKTYNTNVDVIPIDGYWLKQVRNQLKLNREELSRELGISRSYISMVESNLRKPSREVFKKIIRMLNERAIKQGNLGALKQVREKENFLLVYWSPLKKIDIVSGESYVYDLAVESNETFLAGMGGLFVHNTFTMANVIEKVQRPTLVISHNKTLAGQLAQEFRSIFPDNAVEYFVSYYDYYQPEAYVPSSDTYIEKDASINEEIEKLRLSATTSLLTRKDVLVVASVSCIYNLGSPIEYGGAILELKAGVKVGIESILKMLTKMYYQRNDYDFQRATFRVKGDTVDIFPSYKDDAVRVEFIGDKIERVSQLNPVTGAVLPINQLLTIYPAKHYITPEMRIKPAIAQIERDLKSRLSELKKQGKLIEAQRLEQRTYYDLEMIKEFGYCNGIENYSRYFDGRNPGDAPYTLLDYFPKDFLIIIDESHISIPQIRGMYNGDRSRKQTLIEFGFRLPSALDNRPLRFDEFQRKINQAIFVSATPDDYEISLSGEKNIAQQLVRPTGIVDPAIEIKPTKAQIEDILNEVDIRVSKGERVLITTLTKRMAEDLSDFLAEKGIKVNYLHSDIKTLERSDLLQSLRLGEYDVIVGINLLREGLDLPEVSLVIILDADKEGFLRSKTSLVQTMGRAARHVNGAVIMYADKITKSMQGAVDEVNRRREYQLNYNRLHKITPKSIEKAMRERLVEKIEDEIGKEVLTIGDIPESERNKIIKNLENQMQEAANILDFETAAKIRDQIQELKG